MGMGEIKENEATVNEMTQENVEEQPVVYKEYISISDIIAV